MTYLQALQPARPSFVSRLLGPLLVSTSFLIAYFPTFRSLWDGPWQSEQEGHGPLIMAAALWLVWQARQELKSAPLSPAPFFGWLTLLFGLALMFFARTQGVLTVEAFSMIPVLAGCVLLLAGWSLFRVLAFPIFFLLFAVPMPDWLIDAATVPLKVLISDVVTQVLYALGYPIAQNGVMIMIGSYQLLVKDACSGMNSIFALSAIGLFYVHEFRSNAKVRGFMLLVAILPITILANFIRVLTLVLVAYYGSIDAVEALHDVTGIGLFIVAIILMFVVDALLGGIARVLRLGAAFQPVERRIAN